jgi:ABC-type cobalamin/Fe3+-siderophores transport system ATPase subunit
MRLREFEVKGLFGLFDHTIPLNFEQRITIIHAPNGYGKTVILKLLAGFFGGSLEIFRHVEFDSISFLFDDGHAISMMALPNKDSDLPGFKVTDSINGSTINAWEGWGLERETRRHLSLLDRHLPHLARIGPREFRDLRTGDSMGYFEVLERNLSLLPPEIRNQIAPPDWLTQRRGSIHCELIETRRLMTLQKHDSPSHWQDRPAFIPAVRTFSDELSGLIEKTLADGQNVSAALDRTLPKRVLSRLGTDAEPPGEEELRDRLAKLEQLRARLSEVGLLDQSDDSALISQESFDEPTRKFLAEYATDAEQKLHSYDWILPRLELLKRIINDHFTFKTMSVARKSGFIFTDARRRRVALEALSSGEQHELVLVYRLLFKTQPGTLLLVDEPEISLHIAWQKKFLADLRQIIALSAMDVVLATHSPQLIGGYLDLAIQLKPPTSDR